MEKKHTITLRLSYDQFAWLGALCRRSKQTQSAVIRSLIENGTVRERITKEHIHIIRQLIGESTNLNQLAKQANTYGFFAVAERCEEMALRINQLIKQLKDDRLADQRDIVRWLCPLCPERGEIQIAGSSRSGWHTRTDGRTI